MNVVAANALPPATRSNVSDVAAPGEPGFPAYVDTHAHIDDGVFDRDRDDVLDAALAAGVRKIVNIGYRPARWRTSIALSEGRSEVAITLGLHPTHANEWGTETLEELAAAVAQSGACAIGEIGLDYYREGPDPTLQCRVFIAQIQLARRLGCPIVVHQRAAEDDLIEVLAGFPDLPPVVLHSFDGSPRLARFAVERGFIVGVGGLATRAAGAGLPAVLATIPVEAVVLETDSPYLVPAGIKERRNTPANIPIIAGRLAPVWGMSGDEFARQTTETATRVFALDRRRAGEAAAVQ